MSSAERAGTIHVLGEAGEDGHCFLPKNELVERVVERLALPDHQPSPQEVAEIVWQMGLEEQVVLQGHREHQFICYQPPFFHSEQNLAQCVAQLLSRPVIVDQARVSDWIDRYTAATGMQLSQKQRLTMNLCKSQASFI